MIKTLRSLLSWLDRKFPDQVVVTADELKKFRESLLVSLQDLQELEMRLETLEKSIKDFQQEINKFNVAMGFTAFRSNVGASLER